MKIFGIWTVFVALCISIVAAYYSIVGLVAIFAASMIPIIVMGSVLEVGKLTTAVWLHTYWTKANFLMKSYLSIALVLLMFITSMGIFGFLSKAHIEQTAVATENVAVLERVELEIVRWEEVIARAENKIIKLDNAGATEDTRIQEKIDSEQQRIESTQRRLQPTIDDLKEVLADNLKPWQKEYETVSNQLVRLDELTAIDTRDRDAVRVLQAFVKSNPDGSWGPKTAEAVDSYKKQLEDTKESILKQMQDLRDQTTAEVQRVRKLAEDEVVNSNALISSLRDQLAQTEQIDNSEQVMEQRNIINDANAKLEELFTQKFEIESEYRQLEAEVGPVKYIAELIYGEANKDVLEEAVRWVIIILVVVFDPLAVVLVIAGITMIEAAGLNRRKTKEVNIVNEKSKQTEAPKEDAKVETQDAESVGNEKEQESNENQKQNHTKNTGIQQPERLTEEQLSDLTQLEREEYERNYLVLQEQIDQNKRYKEAEQKDTRSRINSVVEKMKDEGRWPNSPVEMPTEREAIREVLSKDDGELAELLEKADQDTLEEVYKEIIKDIKNDG